ncbi:uncharacterized protein O3C94_009197 isoform 2-T4 [Discoglossus pictus]
MEDLELVVDENLLPLFSVQSNVEADSFSRNNGQEGTPASTHTFKHQTADSSNLQSDLHINEKTKVCQNEQRATQGTCFVTSENVEAIFKSEDDFTVGNEQAWENFLPRTKKPIIVKTKDVTKSKVSSAQELFWASMLQAQLCQMELQDELDKKEISDVLVTFDPNTRKSDSGLGSSSVDIEDERVEENLVLAEGGDKDEDFYSDGEMEDESLFCDNPLFKDSILPQPMDVNLQPALELNKDQNDLISFDEVPCQRATTLCDLPLHGMDQLCPWDVKVPGTSSEIEQRIIHVESLEILQIYEDEQEEISYISSRTRNKKWTASENQNNTQERFFQPEDSQLSTAACNDTQKESDESPGTKLPSADDGLLFSASNFSEVSALLLEQDSSPTLPPKSPVAPELPEKTRVYHHEADEPLVCQEHQVMQENGGSLISDEEKVEDMTKETVSEQLLVCPVILIETVDITDVTTDRDVETSSCEDAMYMDNVTNGNGQDQEAARQLATRLFHLDGFERSQVAPYLQKNTEFSAMVAEEYLSLFDFTGKTLDAALRALLQELVLTGETQERERVLLHFSRRFHSCNPKNFSSTDAVHTLTCALMLLNSDLHGQNIGKSMSLQEFINNMDGMNDGGSFSRDLLKGLYHSIRNEKLEWAMSGGELTNALVPRLEKHYSTRKKSNPFMDVPAPDPQAPIYRQGMLLRKVHADTDGKKTPWGKRGWKAFYTVLKGMLLFFLKDEYRSDFQCPEEVISVHHSLAERASEYTKRPHVFRLQTADWRVFLFQAHRRNEFLDCTH